MSVITCIICSDLILPNSEIFTTQCGHLFHHTCLIQWLERAKNCPQCRNKATEKTIHRVYLNYNNSESNDVDPSLLQHKIDSLQFNLTLKEKDVQNYKEKYKKAKTQNVALRGEIQELENKVRTHDSVQNALRDQIIYFKSKCKENEKLTQEVSRLKTNLRAMESTQLALVGTREQVNDMIKNESNIEALALLATTLKKLVFF